MHKQRDLASLITTHQAGVWRYLRLLGCDTALADDLTQETFLVALSAPFEDRGDSAAAAYLRKVARNAWLTTLRRESVRRAVDIADAADALWAELMPDAAGDERLDALDTCLSMMEERERHALMLRFRDDASRAELAAALDMTESGAKNMLQRAKETLRRCVERRMKP